MTAPAATRGWDAGDGGAARSRLRDALVAWSFAAPFLILFTLFMAGPILASFAMSFTDLQFQDIRSPLEVNFVGLQNYAQIFSDRRFLHAAQNTAVFVLIGIPLTVVLGLAAAVGLNQAVVKVRSLYRVGYYLPVVTSIVAIAVVWRLLLNEQTGLVNGLLGLAGVDGPGWLTDQRYALWSIIVMAAWRNMGYLMVIFLAGLQTIPRELYESAGLDGAGAWARFRYITLPLLRPTLLFASVITGIGYLQFFEEPFVMTQGGPLDATLSAAMYVYNQFGFGNYSYASALSYVLFVAIVLLTLAQFRALRPQT